jgi:hypothetical protein
LGVIITLAAASIDLVAGGVLGNTVATYRWVRKRGVRGAGLAGTLPLILNNIWFSFSSISAEIRGLSQTENFYWNGHDMENYLMV